MPTKKSAGADKRSKKIIKKAGADSSPDKIDRQKIINTVGRILDPWGPKYTSDRYTAYTDMNEAEQEELNRILRAALNVGVQEDYVIAGMPYGDGPYYRTEWRRNSQKLAGPDFAYGEPMAEIGHDIRQAASGNLARTAAGLPYINTRPTF